MVSGCGSVGRAVASDTRGPMIKSSHQQKNYFKYLRLTVEKPKIKKNQSVDGPIKNTKTIPTLCIYLPLIDYFKTGSGQLFRDTPMICGGFDKDDGYLASDKCFSLVNGSWHEEVSMGIGIGEA